MPSQVVAGMMRKVPRQADLPDVDAMPEEGEGAQTAAEEYDSAVACLSRLQALVPPDVGREVARVLEHLQSLEGDIKGAA